MLQNSRRNVDFYIENVKKISENVNYHSATFLGVHAKKFNK